VGGQKKVGHLLTRWVRGRAKCRSPLPLFGENHKTTQLIVIWFNKHNSHHLQIQTYSEISKSTICNKACLTQCRVAGTKASEKSYF